MFSEHWSHTSELFDREVTAYNLRDTDYKREVISTFEFLTTKITESLPSIERAPGPKAEVSGAELQSVSYRKSRNEFSDYYIDYMIYKLKNARKAPSDTVPPPTRLLVELEKASKSEAADMAMELVLLCFKQNERFVDERRVYRIGVKLNDVAGHKDVFAFFVQLLALIFMQKDDAFELNGRVCELVERWVTVHLADLPAMDYRVVFSALFGLYGLYCAQTRTVGGPGFSAKFLKAFAAVKLFHEAGFWTKVVDYWGEVLRRWPRERFFYPYTLGADAKPRKVKEPVAIFEMCLNLAVVFLRIPMEKALDLLNAANSAEAITLDQMQKVSYDFEARWIDVQRTRYVSVSDRMLTVATNPNPVITVLKLAVPYIGYGPDLLQVLRLNKLTAGKLRSRVLKQLLLLDSLTEELRMRIWLEIADVHAPEGKDSRPADPSPKSPASPSEAKIAAIIHMDVKRTNFARFYAAPLEDLLIDLAHRYPLVNYYQGMNCIGGYLLNYLDDPVRARRVFCLLISKRLSGYFGNNFEQLKKLIYICERVLRHHLPRLCDHLDKLGIGNVLYISPFLLTIFTSFLQFYQNYSLINKIMDLFISLGWLGFFKVLVFVFAQFEDKLLGKTYDTVLIFLNKRIYEYMFQMRLDRLKEGALRVPVTEGMVTRFGIDFDRSRRVIEEYWSGYFERARAHEKEREVSVTTGRRKASVQTSLEPEADASGDSWLKWGWSLGKVFSSTTSKPPQPQ